MHWPHKRFVSRKQRDQSTCFHVFIEQHLGLHDDSESAQRCLAQRLAVVDLHTARDVRDVRLALVREAPAALMGPKSKPHTLMLREVFGFTRSAMTLQVRGRSAYS